MMAGYHGGDFCVTNPAGGFHGFLLNRKSESMSYEVLFTIQVCCDLSTISKLQRCSGL